MPRTIISPVGLSVLRGLEKEEISLTPDRGVTQLTTHLLNSLGEKLNHLSAEIATLKALKACSKDKVVFLATDTDDSEYAAKVNAKIAEYLFEVETVDERINSLVLDDAQKFKTKGLPSLIGRLDNHVEKAREQGNEPLLNISGGVKPVIPYIALYGMLRRVSINYIFEKTRELVTLPPLPIDFNWTDLGAFERVFYKIDQEAAIEWSYLKNLLGDSFARLEGLFEDQGGGQVTLSAFGFMVLDDFKRVHDIPVMLSPSARKKLNSLDETQRRLIEFSLDRVRSPLWRAHKIHKFHGTDLEVYKPGNTGHRLAGWVGGKRVYVAEIYTAHKEYECDLPKHKKADYDPKSFKEYWPTVEVELLEEEKVGDEMIALAIREKKRAKSERDEALKIAEEVEQQLNKARAETDTLRKSIVELKAEKQKMSTWSIWRRLRWALFSK